MRNLGFKVSYYFFLLVCTIATIGFICFCLYKYSLNDDISQVTFQEFHKKKDNIYPSLTICASSIFYEENLKSYGEGINISTYTDFMNGQNWDDRMIKVDYDNVTLNFSNYLLGVGMWTPDWRYVQGDKYFLYDHRKAVKRNNKNTSWPTEQMDDWIPHFYISYRGGAQKCLTVDIPYMPLQKVWTFGIVFDGNVFPCGIRQSYYEFGVKVHYPGQFLDSVMQKYVWREINSNNSDYVTMRFKIQKLEVITHRKTNNYPCETNFKESDERKMISKLEEVGCKPPWWKEIKDFPVCRSKEHIRMFSDFNLSNYVRPCQSIQKILYTYQDFGLVEDWTQEWLDEVYNMFEVMLEFQDGTYMEIQQIRAYSIQDLVGDIGGYLGLFLGFALLQIPELLLKIYVWMDAELLKKKLSITYVSENSDIEGANKK